ncbi:MAG: hypothetical protein II295_08055 [Akkermansia sp.]|nr:hypothetical protein [Akkermansia sp.]
MKKTYTTLACVLSMLTAHAADTTEKTVEMPADVPGFTMQSQLTWYEIDPGVRTYLILLMANTMEQTAILENAAQSGQAVVTPEQQFDMMQKVIDLTPMDSLKGEYLEFVKESSEINKRIVEALKKEKPTNIAGVITVSSRFDAELEALYAKYPKAAVYFRKDAQMAISLMMMSETDMQRVMMQANMAGKSRDEIMKTVIDHLRRVAADQM